jgi:hypothetical protein
MLEAFLIGFVVGIFILRPLVVNVGVDLVERYERWRWDRFERLHPAEYAAWLASVEAAFRPDHASLVAQLYGK